MALSPWQVIQMLVRINPDRTVEFRRAGRLLQPLNAIRPTTRQGDPPEPPFLFVHYPKGDQGKIAWTVERVVRELLKLPLLEPVRIYRSGSSRTLEIVGTRIPTNGFGPAKILLDWKEKS